MKQTLQNPSDEFILFDEPYTIKRKIPYRISMDVKDPHFPPESVLERGADAVRTYWNNKNLRKRNKK